MSLTKLERSILNVNPSLISKKINKLIQEHIKYKDSIGISEGELTELERLLLDNPSIKFLDYVWKNGFDNYFRVSSIAIKENENLVMYALGRNPKLISSIPIEKITPEMASIYEKYLMDNPTETFEFIHEIPSAFLDNDTIISRIIESTLSKVLEADVEAIKYKNNLQTLMNVLADKEQYIQKMTPYLKELGFFDSLSFNQFEDRLFGSPSFVKEVFLSNYQFSHFPREYEENIKSVLADIIRNTTIDVTEYLKIFSSKEIVEAIMLKNDINSYNFRYMNTDDFSAEDIVRIINENGTYAAPINFVSRADVLKYFISNGDYRFLVNFRKEAFSVENVMSLFDVYEKLNDEQLWSLVEFVNGNPLLTTKFLEIFSNDFFSGKYDSRLIKYINKLDENLFNQQHFDILNKLFLHGEVGKELLKYKFNDLAFSSSFLNYILVNNLYNNYSGFFSYHAYNEENFYLAYQKYGLKYVISEMRNPSLVSKYIKSFPFDKEEEIVQYFEELNNMYSPSLALFFIVNAKQSGFSSEKLDSYVNYYEERVVNELREKFQDEELVKMFISKVDSQERSPFTLDYISDLNALKVVTYFSDITSLEEAQRLVEIPTYFVDRVNKKHIQQIISMLKEKGGTGLDMTLLAMKMYSNIELQRCRDLLNPDSSKNYGPVELGKLNSLFGKFSLYDVEFKEQGNGLLPIYNDELIRIFFGENYKVKNTPIRNYLSGYVEKKQEHDQIEKMIINNSSLNQQEKREKLSELNDAFRNYNFCVSNFVVNRHVYHSRWFSIKEEFLKQQNKSKLKLKLNISKVEEIFKIVAQKTPELEVRDTPLLNSDVFDYVGIDTQYTSSPELARKRAIELSRRMENQTSKKFPNIVKSNGTYTLRVYNPQDRRIISAGYKTNCCFRPNGNADNEGMDNSLLNYCVSNEYGGGLEIVDDKGKVIMFSPLLRNGNVLMIHSIESNYGENPEIMQQVHELLKEYATECISTSYENGDEIDFVTITNLHYLNTKFTEGFLPKNAEFSLFDEKEMFKDAYTNLDSGQAVLAHKEGKTFSDIKYGKVSKSYDYSSLIVKQIGHIEYSEEDLGNIELMEELKEKIIELSNERYLALKANNSQLNLSLLSQIYMMKQQYLTIYKKLMESKKGIDMYSEYSKIQRLIKYIDEETHAISLFDIGNIMYSDDWYINVSSNNILTYNALPGATKEMMERLEMLKKLSGYSKYEHTVIQKEEEQGLSM